jgi:NADP-dependent 3-hydroxy acid dehydrogenase YdfG
MFANVSGYRTALVTGASSGIGAATAEMLASGGLTVHAVARRADRLNALAERTGCIPHAVDITDHAACAAAFDGLEIDVLINNAGLSHNARLQDFPAERLDAILALNLHAVLHLTRLLLPGMVARNRGHVVMLGSMAGHHPMLGSAPYAATKAAIAHLVAVLRLDTNETAIRWTEVAPGRVDTEAFAVILGDAEAARAQFLEGKEPLRAFDVADAICYAVGAPPHVSISRLDIYPTRQASGGFVYA